MGQGFTHGFRPATPDDEATLSSLVLEGVAYWGHDVNFPEAYAGLKQHQLPTRDYIADNPVGVLETDDGRVLGFYGLTVEADRVDLTYNFLAVDSIGMGLGRVLWERSIAEASKHGTRVRIHSDPCAVGFYEAMGARLDRRIEVGPGFFLTELWYDLSGSTHQS